MSYIPYGVRYPIVTYGHSRKFQLTHLNSGAHPQSVYIARTLEVLLLPTYRYAPVSAPIEFYTFSFF